MSKRKEPAPQERVLDGDQAFLDCFCIGYGTSISFLDEQFCALAWDDPNKETLLEYRNQIEQALARRDFEKLGDKVVIYRNAIKQACHHIPLAVAGEKSMSDHSRGGKITAENKAKLHEQIVLDAKDLLTKYPRRGLAQRLQTKKGYNLSERQLNDILQKADI